MDTEAIVFEYDLVCYKGDKRFVFSGDSCLLDFKNNGIDGVTKIGWENKNSSIFANLKNGSFSFNGTSVGIDLGLLSKDDSGNSRAFEIEELVLEPIWFRRIRKVFAPDGITTVVKYCVGWKTLHEDRVSQKIGMLDEKGKVTLSDRK